MTTKRKEYYWPEIDLVPDYETQVKKMAIDSLQPASNIKY